MNRPKPYRASSKKRSSTYRKGKKQSSRNPDSGKSPASNPTHPAGLGPKRKKEYAGYKAYWKSRPVAEVRAYVERNRGNKSLRYKAARAVLSSLKRKASPKKASKVKKASTGRKKVAGKKAKKTGKKATNGRKKGRKWTNEAIRAGLKASKKTKKYKLARAAAIRRGLIHPGKQKKVAANRKRSSSMKKKARRVSSNPANPSGHRKRQKWTVTQVRYDLAHSKPGSKRYKNAKAAARRLKIKVANGRKHPKRAKVAATRKRKVTARKAARRSMATGRRVRGHKWTVTEARQVVAQGRTKTKRYKNARAYLSRHGVKVAGSRKKAGKKATGRTRKGRVMATLSYNVKALDNRRLAEMLAAAIRSGKQAMPRTRALRREFNLRVKAGTMADVHVRTVNNLIASPAVQERAAKRRKRVRAGTAKSARKIQASTKRSRRRKTAKVPETVRWGLIKDGVYDYQLITNVMKDMEASLRAGKRLTAIHTAARNAARELTGPGGDQLRNEIARMNGLYQKNFAVTPKNPSLSKNPFGIGLYSNPNLALGSPAGIAMIALGGLSARLIRGGTDALLKYVEDKQEESPLATNYGMVARFLVSALASSALLFGGSMVQDQSTKQVMQALGTGAMADTALFLAQVIASVTTNNVALYLGGRETNKPLEAEEPAKLLPGTSFSSTAAVTQPDQPKVAGFLKRKEATELARQSYWQGARDVAGYQPKGLLSGYRGNSFELAGMGQHYFSDQMKQARGGMGKAMSLIRTSRHRRLMSGFMA